VGNSQYPPLAAGEDEGKKQLSDASESSILPPEGPLNYIHEEFIIKNKAALSGANLARLTSLGVPKRKTRTGEGLQRN